MEEGQAALSTLIGLSDVTLLPFQRGRHGPRPDTRLEAAGRGNSRHAASGTFLDSTGRGRDRRSPHVFGNTGYSRGGNVIVLIDIGHAAHRRCLPVVIAQRRPRSAALRRGVGRVVAERRLGAGAALPTFRATNRHPGMHTLTERAPTGVARSAARSTVTGTSPDGLAALWDIRRVTFAIPNG